MDPKTRDEKLLALRAKTDRELPGIILRELELALAVVSTLSLNGHGNPPQAERIYRNAVLLLPTLHEAGEAELDLLRLKIEELGRKLRRPRARAAG